MILLEYLTQQIPVQYKPSCLLTFPTASLVGSIFRAVDAKTIHESALRPPKFSSIYSFFVSFFVCLFLGLHLEKNHFSGALGEHDINEYV